MTEIHLSLSSLHSLSLSLSLQRYRVNNDNLAAESGKSIPPLTHGDEAEPTSIMILWIIDDLMNLNHNIHICDWCDFSAHLRNRIIHLLFAWKEPDDDHVSWPVTLSLPTHPRTSPSLNEKFPPGLQLKSASASRPKPSQPALGDN